VRFRIEQIFLTDDSGKVVGAVPPQFHLIDATSVDDALMIFIRNDRAELVGDILKLPGFQAIATARQNSRVYTLQVSPVSDHFKRGDVSDKDFERQR
jgi:hypothetical protein